MALQMFACTATQTCVVNISRPVGHRRGNRPIGDESVLEKDRLRAESQEYRTLVVVLGPYCVMLFLFSSRRWRGIDRVVRHVSSRRSDRPIARISTNRGSMDLVFIIFKFVFFFFLEN